MRRLLHRSKLLSSLLFLPALTGCVGWQSALDAHGPAARHVFWLISLFTGLLGAIWLAVMVALIVALTKHRRAVSAADPLATNPASEQRSLKVVTGLTILTGITVLALTGLSFSSQRRLFETKSGSLVVRVTGHQWWWDVQYQDPEAGRTFTTANEIHIPVGVPVKVELEASDVIHSLWIPSLAGKQDLIPGQQNLLELMASRPGIYRGQCAEFCGLQHAHMALDVIAEDEPAFEQWRKAQRAAAPDPQSAEQQQGERVFLSKPCMMCHQIRGTSAGGRVGPDLTHVGSRRSLAAAELPLTRGTLAAWIADPQGVKPGSKMPLVPLGSDDLNAVAAYLEGLK